MSTGRIPCTEQDIQTKHAKWINLVPSWRKAQVTPEMQADGRLLDPWFLDAERDIITDLLKFGTPIRLGDFADLSDLTQIKAYKVLELLCRSNTLHGDDKNQNQADYFAAKYASELETMPVRTVGGAQVVLSGSLVRVR